jgi:hypothetical protein
LTEREDAMKMVRGYHWTRKAWYGEELIERTQATVVFGIYDGQGGTGAEMVMRWVPLQRRRPSPVLEVFHGSWAVLASFDDVLAELAENNRCITEAEFVTILEHCGFQDFTNTEQE